MNDQLNIKVTNLTPLQRKVYRILRTVMGLRRYEAKLVMLGYLLGEEAALTATYSHVALTDQILKATENHPDKHLAELRHEWEHIRATFTIPQNKYKATIN